MSVLRSFIPLSDLGSCGNFSPYKHSATSCFRYSFYEVRKSGYQLISKYYFFKIMKRKDCTHYIKPVWSYRVKRLNTTSGRKIFPSLRLSCYYGKKPPSPITFFPNGSNFSRYSRDSYTNREIQVLSRYFFCWIFWSFTLHEHNDNAIDLVNSKETAYWLICSLCKTGLSTFGAYVDKILIIEFIRPSKSPAGSSIIFVPKPNRSLWLFIDQRRFNNLTIKNRYFFVLVSKSLNRLSLAKHYTKLKLTYVYYLIYIKKWNKWKTAFKPDMFSISTVLCHLVLQMHLLISSHISTNV